MARKRKADSSPHKEHPHKEQQPSAPRETDPSNPDYTTATERPTRSTAGDHPPPIEQPRPPGRASKSPIVQGVEVQAQKLLHEAGSPKQAKHAVDSAAERETIPDFRQDMLAQRLGFKSRAELLAASKPITAIDGTDWWATTADGKKWTVWCEENMAADRDFASFDEARRHLYSAT